MRRLAAIMACMTMLEGSAWGQRTMESERVEPFKIFDNLYYIGINWVGAYAITTSEGIVLIDSLHGEFVPLVAENLKKLGLDPRDVKYVLVTHGHFDHSGGARALKETTGATVGMTEKDWELVGAGQTLGQDDSAGMKPDLVINDGDTVTLGDTTIKCYVTPGHTVGVLSMEFTVKDGEDRYKAFIFGGVSMNFRGLERTRMYVDSVERLTNFEGIQVNITNHAGMGQIFERASKLKTRNPGDPHPFVDPEGFQAWLAGLLETGESRLKEEEAAAGK